MTQKPSNGNGNEIQIPLNSRKQNLDLTIQNVKKRHEMFQNYARADDFHSTSMSPVCPSPMHVTSDFLEKEKFIKKVSINIRTLIMIQSLFDRIEEIHNKMKYGVQKLRDLAPLIQTSKLEYNELTSLTQDLYSKLQVMVNIRKSIEKSKCFQRLLSKKNVEIIEKLKLKENESKKFNKNLLTLKLQNKNTMKLIKKSLRIEDQFIPLMTKSHFKLNKQRSVFDFGKEDVRKVVQQIDEDLKHHSVLSNDLITMYLHQLEKSHFFHAFISNKLDQNIENDSTIDMKKEARERQCEVEQRKNEVVHMEDTFRMNKMKIIDLQKENAQILKQMKKKVNNFKEKYINVKKSMNILQQRIKFYENYSAIAKTQRLRIDMDIHAPKGPIVVLMFTDIQGSTELWNKFTDQMEIAISLHNELFRKLLSTHNGYECKTEGDAFMITFSNPFDAIRLAIDAQKSLMNLNYPIEMLSSPHMAIGFSNVIVKNRIQKNQIYRGFKVRIGIHIGKVIVKKDVVTNREDYFGPTVNLAARISSLGNGGQIVVSSNIAQEIMKNKRSIDAMDVTITKLGTFSLKGFEKKVKIMEILPNQLKGREFTMISPHKRHRNICQGSLTTIDLLKDELLRLQKEKKSLQNEGGNLNEIIPKFIKLNKEEGNKDTSLEKLIQNHFEKVKQKGIIEQDDNDVDVDVKNMLKLKVKMKGFEDKTELNMLKKQKQKQKQKKSKIELEEEERKRREKMKRENEKMKTLLNNQKKKCEVVLKRYADISGVNIELQEQVKKMKSQLKSMENKNIILSIEMKRSTNIVEKLEEKLKQTKKKKINKKGKQYQTPKPNKFITSICGIKTPEKKTKRIFLPEKSFDNRNTFNFNFRRKSDDSPIVKRKKRKKKFITSSEMLSTMIETMSDNVIVKRGASKKNKRRSTMNPSFLSPTSSNIRKVQFGLPQKKHLTKKLVNIFRKKKRIPSIDYEGAKTFLPKIKHKRHSKQSRSTMRLF